MRLAFRLTNSTCPILKHIPITNETGRKQCPLRGMGDLEQRRRIPVKGAFSPPDSIIMDIDLEIFLDYIYIYMCVARGGAKFLKKTLQKLNFLSQH